MAPVYAEITMSWGGKDYTITPTFGMIQKIEQNLSIAGLISRAYGSNPPYSQMASLLAFCLKYAGCNDKEASAENINYELWHGDDREALQLAASQVMMALVPRHADQGNPTPPKGGSTSHTISTGQSTTKTPSDISGSSPPSSGE